MAGLTGFTAIRGCREHLSPQTGEAGQLGTVPGVLSRPGQGTHTGNVAGQPANTHSSAHLSAKLNLLMTRTVPQLPGNHPGMYLLQAAQLPQELIYYSRVKPKHYLVTQVYQKNGRVRPKHHLVTQVYQKNGRVRPKHYLVTQVYQKNGRVRPKHYLVTQVCQKN